MFNASRMSSIKGNVKIRGTNPATGELIFELDDHNLITYDERDVLGELLIQNTLLPSARVVADLVLETMRMGTSNATPTRSDTDLQGTTAVTKTFSPANVSKISAGVYSFSVSMTTAEGNGYSFSEVGLFTADNTMIARQVHPTYAKDSSLQVDYTWTITLS